MQVDGDGDAEGYLSGAAASDDVDGREVAVGRGVYQTSELPDDAPWDLDQGE
jgi:hypothetical protein